MGSVRGSLLPRNTESRGLYSHKSPRRQHQRPQRALLHPRPVGEHGEVAAVAPGLGVVLVVRGERVAGLAGADDEDRALGPAQVVDGAVAGAVVLGQGALLVGQVEPTSLHRLLLAARWLEGDRDVLAHGATPPLIRFP